MSSSGGRQKQLSARRGSLSASDPWGSHSSLNLNPSRSSSSVLTIARVTPFVTAAHAISSQNPPSANALHARRPSRRGGTVTQNVPTGGGGEQTPGGRLSFAFSSFGGPKGSLDRPSSPTTFRNSIGSSSPGSHRSSPSFTKPRLTPDQLVDLARQATNPRYASVTSNMTESPQFRPQFPAAQYREGQTGDDPLEIAPATFTELPVSVYLPFIDRPSEVGALISSAPTHKLFALLAQTFPSPESEYSPRLLTKKPSPVPSLLPIDPTTWSYKDLIIHLTTVTREACSDVMWARNARRCIRTHSELIWERVKGALGIPPELDVDDDDVFESDEEDEPLGRGIGLGRRVMPQSASPVGLDDEDDNEISESSLPLRMREKATVHLEVPHSGMDDLVAPAVKIEPVIAEPPVPEDGALQDITEDAEDEAEFDDAEEASGKDAPLPPIQGLRISTFAIPSSASLDSPTFRPHYPYAHPHSDPHSGPSSRSGSFSNATGLRDPSFRRTGSFGSQAAVLRRDSFGSFKSARRSDSFGSSSGLRRNDSFGSASGRALSSLAGLAGAGFTPTGVVRADGREYRRSKRAGSMGEFSYENTERRDDVETEGNPPVHNDPGEGVVDEDEWTTPIFPSNFAGLAPAPTLGTRHHGHCPGENF